MSIETLRAQALRLFDHAIAAADPAAALARQFDGATLSAPEGGRLILIAVGKAAGPMMRAALGYVADGVVPEALAVTNSENEQDVPGATLMLAGHPVPDENGLVAGRAVANLLRSAGARDRVIALISGGGSALLPSPVDGVSLAEKAEVNKRLLGAGFDITQMNLVRQQLSVLKGGGMNPLAAPARIEAYILSDVIGDDLRVIASGPTVAPIGTRAQAADLLRSTGLWDKLPGPVRAHLSAPQTPQPPAPHAIMAQNTLICSNRKSLEAMRDAYGPGAVIADDSLEGNVTDAAPRIVHAIRAHADARAVIFGGETTVTLTGTGLGGRNQDLALRFATLAGDIPGPWVFLSGGTDGRDGPTDAAGGLVDPGTVGRISDPAAMLANNDSYRALKQAGDLIVMGATGTNVADVQVFLRG